ncbi:hypothetical protein HYH03_015927 [Edaphochlamys debaryana]|uniref:Bulb-type lectin domain-containing protein n=1 Tax=Edaphochlamys debaryana TaxID=47281 RepID=A0A835XNC0_9CHLO|nr:hypothetical protein HYH03_015927 [Edaphochlamys debaryana]|eukprot:KAG2485346.1 hypothetical protein HYH03_015927 [Edaphochlamys debaryana]
MRRVHDFLRKQPPNDDEGAETCTYSAQGDLLCAREGFFARNDGPWDAGVTWSSVEAQGSALTVVPDIYRKENCLAFCKAMPACKSVVYDGAKKSCTLKSQITGAAAGATAGVTTWFKEWYPDMDDPGADMTSGTKSTFDECAALCTQTPQCMVAVYDPSTRTCRAKAAEGTRIPRLGMYTWVRQSSAKFTTPDLIGYYTGESFTNAFWKDISTPSSVNNATQIRGTPYADVVPGALRGRLAVIGKPGDSITFPTRILPETYTLFHNARYSGVNRGRIFTGATPNVNWCSGFWGNEDPNNKGGYTGCAYRQTTWITPLTNYHGSCWVLSVDQNQMYRSNRVTRTNKRGGTPDYAQLRIGSQGGELSDYQVACVLVYSRHLSDDEIVKIEDELVDEYGLPIGSRDLGTLGPGDFLISGDNNKDKIYSANRDYMLVMQGDANLVLYRVRDMAVMWATNWADTYSQNSTVNSGAGPYMLRVAGNDGHVILTNKDDKVLWKNNVFTEGSCYTLRVTDSGFMEVTDPLGNVKFRRPGAVG